MFFFDIKSYHWQWWLVGGGLSIQNHRTFIVSIIKYMLLPPPLFLNLYVFAHMFCTDNSWVPFCDLTLSCCNITSVTCSSSRDNTLGVWRETNALALPGDPLHSWDQWNRPKCSSFLISGNWNRGGPSTIYYSNRKHIWNCPPTISVPSVTKILPIPQNLHIHIAHQLCLYKHYIMSIQAPNKWQIMFTKLLRFQGYVVTMQDVCRSAAPMGFFFCQFILNRI